MLRSGSAIRGRFVGSCRYLLSFGGVYVLVAFVSLSFLSTGSLFRLSSFVRLVGVRCVRAGVAGGVVAGGAVVRVGAFVVVGGFVVLGAWLSAACVVLLIVRCGDCVGVLLRVAAT